jgi:hypothetical protein
MLKDFAKLHTFLTVIKEKSFSKASAKHGISQPAVTQQIKFIVCYRQLHHAALPWCDQREDQ